MPEVADQVIVVFDGICGLCDRFVAFALRNDVRGELVFTSSQSSYGHALCERLNVSNESAHSIIVVRNGNTLLRSDAVVEIATHLRAPYAYLAYIRLIPRPLRDLGYRLIAAIRRLIPRNHSACGLLPPELQKRIRN